MFDCVYVSVCVRVSVLHLAHSQTHLKNFVLYSIKVSLAKFVAMHDITDLRRYSMCELSAILLQVNMTSCCLAC